MALLTASAIAGLAAAAINGGISAYANRQSQEAMTRYRNALQADRERAAQREAYLENVDPLHTKSGSALSTDMAEKLNDVNTAAAGRNAVMGGGGYNTAATKDVTSRLMSEYQRSLIRQHQMNIVPQLQYYRSQYDRANAGLEKAEYDKSVANINAASQAAQGMINAVGAMGAQMGTPTAEGNGTKAGTVTELAAKGTPTEVQLSPDVLPSTPSYPDQLDPNRKLSMGVGNLKPLPGYLDNPY